MTPSPRAVETRLQLPRWIAALFVGIIALASLAALLAPVLRSTPVPSGSTNVGVITSVVDAPNTSSRVGAQAPDFVWITPLGETTRLSALRGTPVVLNFWATWCKPACVADMPRLEAAARANPDSLAPLPTLSGANITGMIGTPESATAQVNQQRANNNPTPNPVNGPVTAANPYGSAGGTPLTSDTKAFFDRLGGMGIFGPQTIRFLEIDLDEDGAKVRGFFDSLGLTHLEPLIDVGLVVASKYQVGSGVPMTYFIDADGIVRAIHLGEMDEVSVGYYTRLILSAATR